MPTNILMPALSPTMEKGNLARWLKKEGDKIKSGDVIAEIETDKATMEYESIDDGTLAKIVVPEGTQDVAVNSVIAVLANVGEDVKAAASAAKSAPAAAPKSTETPKPQPASCKGGPGFANITETGAATSCPASAGEWRQSDLLIPACAAARERGGARSQSCARVRPAWPRDRARYRGRKIRQGIAWAEWCAAVAGRGAINCAFDVGPADPLTIRRRQL